MTNHDHGQPNLSGTQKVLQVLNEYKEIIVVIAFFLGGVFWIQDRFPTKTDLVAQLSFIKCQLDEYMQLTQLQVRHEQLSAQLAQQLGSATTVSSKVALSPSMKQTLSDLQTQRAQLRAAGDTASAAMQKISDDLGRNLCAK